MTHFFGSVWTSWYPQQLCGTTEVCIVAKEQPLSSHERRRTWPQKAIDTKPSPGKDNPGRYTASGIFAGYGPDPCSESGFQFDVTSGEAKSYRLALPVYRFQGCFSFNGIPFIPARGDFELQQSYSHAEGCMSEQAEGPRLMTYRRRLTGNLSEL